MFLRGVDLVLGVIASLILAGLALLTFADVLFRNAGSAIRGTVEVTELLMGALIFVSLPLVGLRDGHVAVELTQRFLRGVVGRIVALFTRLLSAAVLLVIGWQLWVRADRLSTANDLTATLQIPKAPLAYFMATLCIVAGALLLSELVLGRARLRPPAAFDAGKPQ